MNRIALSLFLIALTTLMAELALVRIFDVIWYSNKAYMTMVMFCFGLAGVQQSLWPMRQDGRLRTKLADFAAMYLLISAPFFLSGLFFIFTVIGGIASVLISIYLGFNLTLLCAAMIYALPLPLFMRNAAPAEAA